MTTLRYTLVSLNRFDTFEGAAPWHGQLGKWEASLGGSQLTATAQSGSPDDLDAALRAWETLAFLRDQHRIVFVGEGDAAPEPDEQEIVRRVNLRYPEPDASFARTGLVDRLMELIWRYRHGELPLPEAIHHVLEALVAAAGQSGVSGAFNIDQAVLDTASDLAARGYPIPADGSQPRYRGPEWQWLQEALRLVTLQAGRRPSRPMIELAAGDFVSRL